MARLLAACSLIFVTVGAAAAQSNSIRGKIRSTSGASLNNAIVELRRSGGAILSQTVTRNDGDFAFTGLEYGEYEIGVMLTGYEPKTEIARFRLPPGMGNVEVLNLEIIVRPKPDVLLGPPGVSFAQDVPQPAKAAYEKALVKSREGKPAEAVPLLREAISLFNDYFNAHLMLGTELLRLGKYQEALEALERARQINDRQSAVFFMFGQVMLKQGKLGVAEYAFREAVRLNGNSFAARFYHGVVLVDIASMTADQQQKASDLAEAEKELITALDLSEKRLTAVYVQLSRVCERKGDKEGAARYLETYLKAEPNDRKSAEIKQAIVKLRGGKK